MTTISTTNGRVILVGGAVGTDAACCCGGCCCIDGLPDTLKTTQAACEEAGGTWLPAGEFLHCGGMCPGFAFCAELYAMELLDPDNPPPVPVNGFTSVEQIEEYYGAYPFTHFYNASYSPYGDMFPGVLFLMRYVTEATNCAECEAGQFYYAGRPMRICETMSVPCPNPCPNPFP